MRKLKWYYVSPNPESWFDRKEILFFGPNGKKHALIYLVGFAVTTLINLIFY